MKLDELREQIEADGLRETVAPRLTGAIVDGAAIDRDAAAASTCAGCGHKGCDFVAFQHPETGSYRAVAVCPRCDTAVEF